MHLTRCANLKILFLSGNRIQWKDLQNLNKLKTLVKLDLTGNDLQQMPGTEGYYGDMKDLEMLVLDKNRIQRFKQIEGLTKLPSLKHLSLEGNPVTEMRDYRFELAYHFQELTLLDRHVITYDERMGDRKCRSIRFRTLNTFAMVDY